MARTPKPIKRDEDPTAPMTGPPKAVAVLFSVGGLALLVGPWAGASMHRGLLSGIPLWCMGVALLVSGPFLFREVVKGDRLRKDRRRREWEDPSLAAVHRDEDDRRLARHQGVARRAAIVILALGVVVAVIVGVAGGDWVRILSGGVLVAAIVGFSSTPLWLRVPPESAHGATRSADQERGEGAPPPA